MLCNLYMNIIQYFLTMVAIYSLLITRLLKLIIYNCILPNDRIPTEVNASQMKIKKGITTTKNDFHLLLWIWIIFSKLFYGCRFYFHQTNHFFLFSIWNYNSFYYHLSEHIKRIIVSAWLNSYKVLHKIRERKQISTQHYFIQLGQLKNLRISNLSFKNLLHCTSSDVSMGD